MGEGHVFDMVSRDRQASGLRRDSDSREAS